MSGIPEEAMVLAAGLGTRMRPLTDATPKPLINVAGKALIDYTLDRFAKAGVTRAVVNVHYLAEQVERHVKARSAPKIIISDERGERLETGGGLKKARPLFQGSSIFCANTDAILIDEDSSEACARLHESWDPERMDALLLLVPVGKTSGYDGAGDFRQEADGQIALRDGETAPLVFTGLQILRTTLIDEGPQGAFSTRLLWDKARAGGRLMGLVHQGDWLHVGDPEGLAAAETRIGGSPS